jgi:ribonuclease VapC
LSFVVLDASALLALLRSEDGAKVVEDHLEGALMASVNYGEVAQLEFKDGKTRQEFGEVTAMLEITVVAVDVKLALDAAEMRELARARGMSQADCICLALAKSMNVPALTSDRAWASIVELVGVDVKLIR